jgi:hypothetical protein
MHTHLRESAGIIPFQQSIMNQKAGPSRTNSQKIAEAENCRFQLTLSTGSSRITFKSFGLNHAVGVNSK